MTANDGPAPNDDLVPNDGPATSEEPAQNTGLAPNDGPMAGDVPMAGDGAMASAGPIAGDDPMIGVTVRYFAVFREQAGTATESLTTRAATAAELYAEVADRHGLEDPAAHCKVAVNDELAAWDRILSEGDVVLFFPPVAGG